MSESHTELLLLPDGRIFVHNLSPTMAALLHQLDTRDRSMTKRAVSNRSRRPKCPADPQVPLTSHKP